mmetsp:Transcript_6012/g.18378  ORF Transcript_6012/g.18378 Transcript_6012/m.18378 type:complete len:612 (-) Transcript_6012:101-1936(-)
MDGGLASDDDQVLGAGRHEALSNERRTSETLQSPEVAAELSASASPTPTSSSSRAITTNARKICPEAKCVQGTSYIVDGFQYVNAMTQHYFLTHYHSDHYGGLRKTFHEGTIYCSKITGTLVQKKLGVASEFIRILPMCEAIEIEEGVTVSLLEANHCPGAVLFLFDVRGAKLLHTGDMRWCPELMRNYPELIGLRPDILYLDTTYSDPTYCFPPQKWAIEKCLEIIRRELAASTGVMCKPPLFLFGTYTIGKERLFLRAAQVFGKPLYADPAKRAILKVVGVSPSLMTSKPLQTNFHVASMGHLSVANLERTYEENKHQFGRVIGFRPTGWALDKKDFSRVSRRGSATATLYSIPYSEHSSFRELVDCVSFLKPHTILPTVGGRSNKDRNRLVRILREAVGVAESDPNWSVYEPEASASSLQRLIINPMHRISSYFTRLTSATTTMTCEPAAVSSPPCASLESTPSRAIPVRSHHSVLSSTTSSIGASSATIAQTSVIESSKVALAEEHTTTPNGASSASMESTEAALPDEYSTTSFELQQRWILRQIAHLGKRDSSSSSNRSINPAPAKRTNSSIRSFCSPRRPHDKALSNSSAPASTLANSSVPSSPS